MFRSRARHLGSLAGISLLLASCPGPGAALTITPTFDSNVTGSQYAAQIEAGFAAAAAAYTSAISTNINVMISVDWSSQSYLGAAQDSLSGYYSYGTIRSALLADAASHAAALFLPSVTPAGGPSLYALPAAELKALGGTSQATHDAIITFSSAHSWTFDPAGGVLGGTYDFVAVAEHEIAHALGRAGGVFSAPGTTLFRTPLDLYRYTSPGNLANTDSAPNYLSLDGGATSLQQLSTTGDTSDVIDTADAQTAFTGAGTAPSLTFADLLVLQSLGYTLDLPEPGCLLVFGVALAGLNCARRRKRKLQQPGFGQA